MKTKLNLIIPTMTLILLAACAPAQPTNNVIENSPGGRGNEVEMPIPSEPEREITGTLKTIWVGAELVDCTGVAPQKCMQVKWEKNEAWRLFYNQISGFLYEPGFEYELIVEERDVENPAADASSLEWILIEVTEKTQTGEVMSKPTGLGSGEWKLVEISGTVLETSSATINFDFTSMQATGNSGCNSFFGGFTYDEIQLGFGPLGSTMMACEQEYMEQEAVFLNLLAQIHRYEIVGDRLKLMTMEGQWLIFIAGIAE